MFNNKKVSVICKGDNIGIRYLGDKNFTEWGGVECGDTEWVTQSG